MKVILGSDEKPRDITMVMPFDGHQHVRKGETLKTVVPLITARFQDVIVMPNTKPPITTLEMAKEYRGEIGKVDSLPWTPRMTLYLTDTLQPEEIEKDTDRLIVGVKYYPRGLTTNSDEGVEDPASLWTQGSNPYNVLRILAEHDRVLLLHAADGIDKHGELLEPEQQEPHFIRETLPRIRYAHPDLKISVEHLSTRVGAEYMHENGNERLGCSLTSQHLLLHKGLTFRGGLRPHEWWWPMIQSKEDREALRELARAGKTFVWLGSDSAPHPKDKKEAACCVGGVLTAHAGIELYAEAFEDMGALDERFEQFASIYGPRFYGIPASNRTIQLTREPWTVRQWFYAGAEEEPIRPFRLGETIRWKLVS